MTILSCLLPQLFWSDSYGGSTMQKFFFVRLNFPSLAVERCYIFVPCGYWKQSQATPTLGIHSKKRALCTTQSTWQRHVTVHAPGWELPGFSEWSHTQEHEREGHFPQLTPRESQKNVLFHLHPYVNKQCWNMLYNSFSSTSAIGIYTSRWKTQARVCTDLCIEVWLKSGHK